MQWLADAKKAWPVLHLPEIEALWDLFEKYADPISKEITKDGVSQILDESLRQLFDKIDVDRSGVLEREEIHGLVHALGRPKHTPQQLDRVMEALDQDGDGGGDLELCVREKAAVGAGEGERLRVEHEPSRRRGA